MEPKSLCQELTLNKVEIDSQGMIKAPEKPGTGIEINIDAVKKYLVDVELKVNGKPLYLTPRI